MFASILMIGSVLLGQAEAVSNESLQLEVRRLVRQLDAPQLTDRDEAEEKLLSLGPDIIDLLPEPTDRTSAETKQRLTRILQKLQLAAARLATKASLVTLKAQAMPLSQIIAELEKQTGNKIVDSRQRRGHPVTDPKLDVDFDKVPFFKALDEVLDKAELTVYPFEQSGAIDFVTRGETQLPRAGRASYNGPFRFEATEIVAKRDLRDTSGKALRVILEVAWEPRLAPISIVQRLAKIKAIDENGNSLEVESDRGKFEISPVEGATTAQLILPLILPSRKVGRIAELSGQIEPTIPGKMETFRFDDLTNAKNVEQRLAGTKVTLERVRRNNQTWEVRIRVGFDQPGGSLQSHRGWIFRNEAYLEDADGTKIPFDGMPTTRQAANDVGIAYIFALDGPPEKHTFVYKAPGTIATSTFDYKIKDVELP